MRKKPSRKCLLKCAITVLRTMYDTYQNRIHTLNRLDKAIYNGAQRILVQELGPTEAKQVLDEFEKELTAQREKAERARDALKAKKEANGGSNATGNSPGS